MLNFDFGFEPRDNFFWESGGAGRARTWRLPRRALLRLELFRGTKDGPEARVFHETSFWTQNIKTPAALVLGGGAQEL